MPSDPPSPQRRGLLRLAIGTALLAGARRTSAAGSSSRTLSLAGLHVGRTRTVEIEGHRVLLLRRDMHMIDQLKRHAGDLADPQSRHSQQPAYAQNPWRSEDPTYLIMINHCTFDGCPTKFGGCPGGCGFSCPCCGSQFDAAGRVHKFQPAPRNLAIPYYRLDRQGKTVLIERIEEVKAVE